MNMIQTLMKLPNQIWRNKEGLGTRMSGYFIGSDSIIYSYDNGILCKNSYNVFATKKQAKAALAMARISQIIANDERFGGLLQMKNGCIMIFMLFLDIIIY